MLKGNGYASIRDYMNGGNQGVGWSGTFGELFQVGHHRRRVKAAAHCQPATTIRVHIRIRSKSTFECVDTSCEACNLFCQGFERNFALRLQGQGREQQSSSEQKE